MTDDRSPGPYGADSHDLIRVQGARVNNLRDVDVEIPKRRLTVFTGVSGSGKSSLVFGTIAAESQRLINETYSAFVQGFMPTLARPEVDVLDGLTTAIIVDQERLGANARSTVGTATDANAMLRILFSRLGQPHIGPPNAYSFNVPSVRGQRRDHRGAGRRRTKTEKAHLHPSRRDVPALRGHGRGHRHRPVARCTTTASRSTRVRSPSPATAWRAGTAGSSAALRLLRPGQADPQITRKSELHDLLHQEPTKIKIDGHQPDLRGPDPADPEVVPVQGRRRAAAAHPGLRGAGGDLHAPAPSATAPGSPQAARSSKIDGINIADACAMQISDLADWVRGLAEPVGGPAAGRRCGEPLDSFVEIGLGYLSLDRPVRHAVRRRGAADQDDPPPRLLADRRHLRLRRADRSGCTRTTSSG